MTLLAELQIHRMTLSPKTFTKFPKPRMILEI